MPEKLTGDVLDLATIDTRSSQAKYFKTFQDAEGKMDDGAFKKAINAAKGKYNKPVLVIESLSSHYGYVNGNQAYYKPENGPKSAKTFIAPYQKPVLKGHNMFSDSDPIGRVTDARYVPFEIAPNKAKDLTTRKGVIRTFSTITDPDAIEKVMDNRFLTQSVSGVTPSVDCSICGANWKDKPCEHNFGDMYDNKLCYKVFGPIDYQEVSFVWKPADKEARTLRFQTVGPKDALDMMLRDAIQINQVEDGAYEELSYYLYDGCGSRRKMYSFADNKEVASDNIAVESNQPEAKQTSSQVQPPKKTNPDRRSPMDKVLSECTIQDILGVAMVKEHVAGLVKDAEKARTDAETTVQTLTAKVKDLEAAAVEQKKALDAMTEKVKAIDTQRFSSKVEHLVDTLVKLQKPQVKAILDEKDEKKKGELRATVIADYAKKSEAVIDEITAIMDAEVPPKQEPDKTPTQMVQNDAANRDSRIPTAGKRASLTSILDKK